MPDLSSFAQLEQWLAEATDYERQPGSWGTDLARVEALMQALGGPQRDLHAVHVAGTTGKGTTCAAVASILAAEGLRTGLYTSPHLIDLRERIRLGARPAPDAAWLWAATQVRRAAGQLEEPPTWFELVTAIAFLVFREAELDAVILEVGLGGRLDATNVVDPRVAVITRIARDHTAILGDSLAQIAGEKAGILKRGVAVVAGPEAPDAVRVVRTRAQELDCSLWLLGEEFGLELGPETALGGRARVWTPEREYSLAARLPRGPVWSNVALAVAAAERFLAGESRQSGGGFTVGVERLSWRGRCDLLPGPPAILVDGAHDPASIDALRETALRRLGERFVLLFAMARDKEVAAAVKVLAPHCAYVVCCPSSNPRALPTAESQRLWEAQGVSSSAAEDVAAGIVQAQARASELGLSILATGSIYLAGEILAWAGQDPAPAWRE